MTLIDDLDLSICSFASEIKLCILIFANFILTTKTQIIFGILSSFLSLDILDVGKYLSILAKTNLRIRHWHLGTGKMFLCMVLVVHYFQEHNEKYCRQNYSNQGSWESETPDPCVSPAPALIRANYQVQSCTKYWKIQTNYSPAAWQETSPSVISPVECTTSQGSTV